ncbi:MAG: MaoC family dehydratase N-terminal domain-containing protein [Dehalococcoidia bacterium]|nr:MaoC family dehydratase N-terminal domain-containing protein [Dehalococcoidia bacterium]
MTHSLHFTDLEKGQAFARLPLTVTNEDVDAYLESTGESSEPWRELVPPIYLDAIAIATLLSTVAIPKGVMHTGQEHESHRAARIGEPLTLEMRVSAMSERRGAIMAAFEAELTDAQDASVSSMKISVMALPDGVTA